MPLTYGHKHILVKPWVKQYPISRSSFGSGNTGIVTN